MPIPVVIFAVCLCAGVAAGVRWLPNLATGPVGGLAFFAVCGLLGAALAVLGLHIYSTVENLNGFGGHERGAFLASSLESMLWDTGTLLGLAVAVYLLAPPAEIADELLPDMMA